ncbi:VanZ family protein [Paenarthrobacter sp. NPDC089714]|uniref:VanZ family protein n=1 Tax=Paenarthrobacter sp. NPDC089714 TaxID=3364377 RepID=UPI00381C1D33
MTTAEDSATRRAQRWLQAAFAAYLVALALVVFLPSKEASTVTGFVGIIAGWLAAVGLPLKEAAVVVEFVSNIVMFVPFGGLVRLLWPRRWNWWRILLLGAATSTFIELTQLLVPGRVTALSDVIANTAGAVIGAAAAGWWLRRSA